MQTIHSRGPSLRPYTSHGRVLLGSALIHHSSSRSRVARAKPEDKSDDSFESLFNKELQRRGLSSMDEAMEEAKRSSSDGPSTSGQGSAPASSPEGGAPGTNPFAGTPSGTSTRTRPPRSAPPPMAPANAGEDQRQKSMDMVNEGLEGLLPRASILLRLGGSVFLAFLPFMLVFSLLFSGVYSVFGDNFLHGGRRSSSPPAYIDPERLLSEPTVDPYVPYNSNPYSSPELK